MPFYRRNRQMTYSVNVATICGEVMCEIFPDKDIMRLKYLHFHETVESVTEQRNIVSSDI